MTGEETARIESLVIAYENAHAERMGGQEGGPRKLWASQPILAEYRAVSEAVRAAAPRPRHSDAFVEGYVDDLLQSILEEPAAISAHVRALREKLEHVFTTRLYVPLDGIQIAESDLLIGAVRLVRMDDDAFDNLVVGPFAHVMDLNPHYDDQEAARWVEWHRERMNFLHGRTCVEITTDLDLASSEEVAELIVDDVCDFLQTCIAGLVPRDARNPVRRSNGVIEAWKVSFGASDGPCPRTNSGLELAFGGHSPTLDGPSVDGLCKSGIFALGVGLGVPPATEYGALLRRAVRWFAKGEREPNPDDRKLAYVTAVDLFFQHPPDEPGDGRGVVQRFCEGVGFALEENPIAVARVARSVYPFYKSRSQTSHAGHVDVETDKSVDHLRWIVMNFLSSIVDRPFAKKSDVDDWVADRIRLLTTDEKDRLRQAASWKVVATDDALGRTITLLAARPAGAESVWRERRVLCRLLQDAVRSEHFLDDLRPFATALEAAVTDAAKRGDHTMDAALKALSSLRWIEEGYQSRLSSDII